MSARRENRAAALLAAGFQELQQGRPAQARLSAQKALEIAPRNPDALQLLGVIALQQAEHETAVDLLKRAISVRPDDAACHCNLAYAYIGLKRLPEALAAFERAVRLQPQDPELQLDYGNCLAMTGKTAEAETVFRRLVERHPQYPLAWFNLANAVRDQERYEEARDLYLRVIRLSPRHADAHVQLGATLLKLEDPAAALERFREAEALNPGSPELHLGLGAALGKLEQLDEAAQCLQRAVSLAPDHAGARNNLGMLLWQRGEYDAALTQLRRALSLKTDYAEAHYNIAMVHIQQDRAQEGLASLEQALHCSPDYAAAKFSRGLLRLLGGDLERGWQDYEWRFRPDLDDQTVGIRPFPQREWRGEPLAGRKILVWGEQGVGDQLLHAGMIGELAAASAQCVFECVPKLVPLLARSFPQATVVATATPPHDVTRGQFDFQAPSGDLARWLRAAPGHFPAHRGYLVPDPARVAYWQGRLAALGAGPKIGFAWRSSNVKRDRAPADIKLDGWGPVFSAPGAHFVCLQYGDCTAELAQAQERLGVRLHAFPEIDLFNDLDEAAALTRAVDLVVSAPTAVSVLSSALGVPTWQLSFGLDWQRLGTSGNPWFPAMRVFWRGWNRHWPEVIQEVGGELRRQLDALPSSAAG